MKQGGSSGFRGLLAPAGLALLLTDGEHRPARAALWKLFPPQSSPRAKGAPGGAGSSLCSCSCSSLQPCRIKAFSEALVQYGPKSSPGVAERCQESSALQSPRVFVSSQLGQGGLPTEHPPGCAPGHGVVSSPPKLLPPCSSPEYFWHGLAS